MLQSADICVPVAQYEKEISNLKKLEIQFRDGFGNLGDLDKQDREKAKENTTHIASTLQKDMLSQKRRVENIRFMLKHDKEFWFKTRNLYLYLRSHYVI